MGLRSGFEGVIQKLLQESGIKFGYETRKIPYTLSLNYVPDFIAPSGALIETKGYFKPEDRRKMLAVKRSNPKLDIRLWFQRDNWLNKNKKSKYSDWAVKHGFPYHVGDTLPEEWLNDFTKKKK